MTRAFTSHARAYLLTLCAAATIAFGSPASAQTQTVRLAKQFGISYLPLTVIEEKKLLEILRQQGVTAGSYPTGDQDADTKDTKQSAQIAEENEA